MSNKHQFLFYQAPNEVKGAVFFKAAVSEPRTLVSLPTVAA